jgi:hypothetical protein
LIDPLQEWKQQRLVELELGFGIPPLLRFVPLISDSPHCKEPAFWRLGCFLVATDDKPSCLCRRAATSCFYYLFRGKGEDPMLLWPRFENSM